MPQGHLECLSTTLFTVLPLAVTPFSGSMYLSSVITNANSKSRQAYFPDFLMIKDKVIYVVIKSTYEQFQWGTHKVLILSESRTGMMWSWSLQRWQQFPDCARGAWLSDPHRPLRWHHGLIISVHQRSACHSLSAHWELSSIDLNRISKPHLIPVICQVRMSLKDKR